jgi:hypothetical protein
MSITITSNANEVAASLERKASQINQAVTAKLNALTLALQQHIIADKLQGQVLKQHGGSGVNLADSIRVVPAAEQGGSIVASVIVDGPADKYAAYQEFGTSATELIEPKKTKALRFLVGGKEVFTKKVIHPPLKARSFMASSLDDMHDQFASGINDAVQQVLEAE